MPLDATRNSLVLPLLGLLVEQPAHAYDLTSRLATRYAHLTVTRSSVTSLLRSLAAAGLVQPRPPERVGRRPPRTAYELTEAGLAGFRSRVEEGLRDAPAASPVFVTALAYVSILARTQAVEILQARIERLGRERDALDDAAPPEVTDIHMIEVSYWRRILTVEAGWLAAFSARISAGDYRWTG
ncbi:MAG: helix-turn-helix transcriptional regulator [Actinoplanes sp.]